LGLENVKHSVVGGGERGRGISGGQRRRVNIGIELGASPLALFCDEPTSGLDSTSALKVTKILKSVSKLGGITVVCVIHQPRIEIFEKFDDVLMLVPGGRTGYFGPVKFAQRYFESLGFTFLPNLNPADVMMDILSGRGSRFSSEENGGGVRGASGGSSSFTSVNDLVRIWEETGMAKVLFWQESSGIISYPLSSTTQSNTPSRSTMASDITSMGASTTSYYNFRGLKKDPTKLLMQHGAMYTSHNHTPYTQSIMHPQDLKTLTELAEERGAPPYLQIYHSHNRSLTQQFRNLSSILLELIVSTLAGSIMGICGTTRDQFQLQGEMYHGILVDPYTPLSSTPNEWFLGLYATLMAVAVTASGGPAGCRIFGEERGVYWREASSGHSKVAYFVVSKHIFFIVLLI
jgi:energy-coupling factor transporter ATP-binding protein EcfA2